MKDEYKNIAPYYDFLTRLFFMGSMVKAKLSHLDSIDPSAKVLILGGGTGLELAYLAVKYPGITVHYVEKSKAMLEKARKRVSRNSSSEITYILSDSIPEENYDVVITSFFMDVFEEKELITRTRQILRSLEAEGYLIVTDFIKSEGRGFWQGPLLWSMYSFFRWTTGLKTRHLEDFDYLLLTLGMTKMNEHYYFGKFIASRIYQKNNILHL